MNDVSRWLYAGADVHDGLPLLSRYCPNKWLAELVSRRPDKFRYLLVRELRRFADDADARSSSDFFKPREKFRESWPFLSEPDCPDELKILASDKITAYHNYCKLHRELTACASPEECFETAKNLLKNYRQNYQIFLEFAYWRDNRSLLGKHPVFKKRQLIEKYGKMSLYQLAKEQHRLEGAIWRIKSEIGKGDKPQLREDREARLFDKTEELNIVNSIIGKKDGTSD